MNNSSRESIRFAFWIGVFCTVLMVAVLILDGTSGKHLYALFMSMAMVGWTGWLLAK